MDKAEQFFYDNAGFSYNAAVETPEQGRVRCANTLADAEKALLKGPYFVSWAPDPEPWDGDEPYDGPLWVATLWSVEGISGKLPLESLGSVACEEGDPYQRVVEAELMAVHLASEK